MDCGNKPETINHIADCLFNGIKHAEVTFKKNPDLMGSQVGRELSIITTD